MGYIFNKTESQNTCTLLQTGGSTVFSSSLSQMVFSKPGAAHFYFSQTTNHPGAVCIPF